MSTTELNSTPFNHRQEALRSSIAGLSQMLSADGGSLEVISLNPEAVELRLQLDDVDCADCVLPPDRLRATIVATLSRDTGAAIAVALHDPRVIPEPVADQAPLASSFVVLDPCGIAPDDGVPDAGPDAGPLAGKTVAIRHDVLWPAFDWTVEEWKEALEERGATVLLWPRAQGEKDEVLDAADAEFDALLAGADLAISGLANCGSCTSWSVRDAILAAKKGLPTTVVATAHFESLAHMLAAEAGFPGLRVTVLPYPYSTLPEAEVRAHGRATVDQLLDVLGATV